MPVCVLSFGLAARVPHLRRKQKWDKRFCELSETGYIHYYKKEGGKNAGSVFLLGAPVTVDREDTRLFNVETSDRTFVFKAATPVECLDWVHDVRYYSA